MTLRDVALCVLSAISSIGGYALDINKINLFIQSQLQINGWQEATAIEAAKWLDFAGLLKDSTVRLGYPLRNLLRKGLIIGQYQKTNRRWFIRLTEQELDFQEVGLERIGTVTNGNVLPDYLGYRLRVVFVGTIVGNRSAAKKHYYSGKNNKFWSLLKKAGIIDKKLFPKNDYMVLDFGVGLTDIVKDDCTSNDENLNQRDFSIYIQKLNEKIKKYKPIFVCFNGMNAYEIYSGKKSKVFGLQENRIYESRIFIVPSTSGRVSSSKIYRGRTRLEWFKELGRLLKLDGFA